VVRSAFEAGGTVLLPSRCLPAAIREIANTVERAHAAASIPEAVTEPDERFPSPAAGSLALAVENPHRGRSASSHGGLGRDDSGRRRVLTEARIALGAAAGMEKPNRRHHVERLSARKHGVMSPTDARCFNGTRRRCWVRWLGRHRRQRLLRRLLLSERDGRHTHKATGEKGELHAGTSEGRRVYSPSRRLGIRFLAAVSAKQPA
jgi:hypothetical protein